ncbi:MAG: H-NS histone family protein, partial [Rhizobiales bacterium]|nr:H-NS histone family protein [Hyphomicrobiales bacterium]
RDPATGATWAGVGATPRWLKEYAAAGRPAEEFAISGGRGAKSAALPKKRGRKPGRPRKVGRPRKAKAKNVT